MQTSANVKLARTAAELGPAMASLASSARNDPAVFCQFVLRHEETGQPVRLAPMHVEWHDMLSANNRVVLWTHTEAGKTQQISVARVLWEIGRNPNIRILILSSSSGSAKKIVKAIKTYIERSAEFRLVFPNVVPDKSANGSWQEAAFHVRRATISKDPTVQAAGYGGQILGSRYDLIIIDDYLTAENTYSEPLREKYYGWLKSTIEGRRTARGRLWFVGNAWHHDDAMHRYAAEPATTSRKYPVRNEDGESSWPEVWPQERIDQEIENRGPIESRRSLFCDPVADADRRFKSDYILRALHAGDGLELAYALSYVPPGYRTITGVDLAVTKKSAADDTALVTIAVEDRTGSRQLLDVTAGKMSGPEIVDAIIDVHNRYNSIVWVESNAAQAYIKQFTNERSAVPIKPFFTGKNKADPAFGIESLAIEMSAGKWVIPNRGAQARGIHASMDPEVRKLINELFRYDPTAHTGDRLMAMWLAREGARKGGGGPNVGKRPRRT